jgi:hypothetical protein
MTDSDEDLGRSRRPSADDWGWSNTGQTLGGQTIERSDHAVCDLHHAQGDKECEFLGSASKPRSTVSPGLTSKLVGTVLVVWLENQSLGFLGLRLKISRCVLVIWPTKSLRWFLGLCLKTKWEEVYRFAPQNQWADEDGVRTRVDIRRITSSWSKSG